MQKFLIIGLGGFVGAIARYAVSGLPHKWLNGAFPWGTLLVNALGCLIIGAMMFLVQERRMFTAEVRYFIFIGFLGSFTTFSTFGYETLALFKDAQYTVALANVAANMTLCLVAVWAGWSVVKMLNV